MARRRSTARPHGWDPWLAVPAALILDAAAAAYLAGKPVPLGLAVPDAILVAAPLVVYGVLAALVFRARPLGTRLAAAAILLGIHVGLIALHTVCYVALWSLPAPAAIRLAHRWSPLIPLLQLIWVPLLALPLVTLTRRGQSPAPRRSASLPSRRDARATWVPQTGSRMRVQPDREVRVEPDLPGPVAEIPPPLAHVEAPRGAVVDAPLEAPPPVELEPVPTTPSPPVLTALPMVSSVVSPSLSSVLPVKEVVVEASDTALPVSLADTNTRTIAPTPVWVDELVEASPPPIAPVLPRPQPVALEHPSDDHAAVPPTPLPSPMPALPPLVEPVALALAPPSAPVIPEPIAPPSESAGDIQEVQRTLPRAVESPVDPYLVARVFEPYGPLLSRDRTVVVDWTPGPETAVLCAAPRGPFRDEVVGLGARLGRVLATGDTLSAAVLVRRVSLRGREGVVVITPLDGAVLVAAARRHGALALLEVLSARVVPGPGSEEPDTASEDAASADPAVTASGATRLETPTAIVDVLGPAGVQVAPMGELVGQLLATVLAAGGLVVDTLSVHLESYRLMVHPVHPDAQPPRFVAVVGGREQPGLLGRRAEQAARALREAS